MTRIAFAITIAATLCGATAVNGQTVAEPAVENANTSRAVLLAPLLVAPTYLTDDAVSVPVPGGVTVQDRRATVPGLVVGGLVGVAAGLIFVHTSCNEDPCIDAAYVLGAAVGATVFGGIGALIGSQVSR